MKQGAQPTTRMRNSDAHAGSWEFGGVFIEIVLVLPIMLLISLGSLGLANQLKARGIASVLSRELATALFKNCADITIQRVGGCDTPGTICVDEDRTVASIQQCINQIKSKFDTQWGDLKPANTDGEVAISLDVYRYDIKSLAILATCDSANASTTLVSLSGSSTGNSFPPSIPDVTSMCQRNRVVRADVRFQIKLLTPFIPTGHATNLEMRDETVM